MSDLASTSGTGSPSLSSTLRQFRPRKRCLQQSTTTTTPLRDKGPEQRNEPIPPPSQNKVCADVIPKTPASALKKAVPELTQSRRDCPAIQATCSTSSARDGLAPLSSQSSSSSSARESEAVDRGMKRKQVLSSNSEGDEEPKELQRPINNTATKNIKVELGANSSLVKQTRYMTDKERSLKELRKEFKTTDIMNVLAALVACNWHVGQARTHLLNKTGFRGHSQQGGQGSEERDVKPNLANLNRALGKHDNDGFCSEDIYVKNLKGGLSKVKFLGGFWQNKPQPKVAQQPKESQQPVVTAEDDSDNEDCDENMYVKDLRGGLTKLSAFSEPEQCEPPQNNATRRLRRRRRRQ